MICSRDDEGADRRRHRTHFSSAARWRSIESMLFWTSQLGRGAAAAAVSSPFLRGECRRWAVVERLPCRCLADREPLAWMPSAGSSPPPSARRGRHAQGPRQTALLAARAVTLTPHGRQPVSACTSSRRRAASMRQLFSLRVSISSIRSGKMRISSKILRSRRLSGRSMFAMTTSWRECLAAATVLGC